MEHWRRLKIHNPRTDFLLLETWSLGSGLKAAAIDSDPGKLKLKRGLNSLRLFVKTVFTS